MASDDALREAIERALPCVDTCKEITGRHMPWCPGYWRDDVDEKVAPLIAAARLEGWRAGREAAAAWLDRRVSGLRDEFCEHHWPATRACDRGCRFDPAAAIRALPEPGSEEGVE